MRCTKQGEKHDNGKIKKTNEKSRFQPVFLGARAVSQLLCFPLKHP